MMTKRNENVDIIKGFGILLMIMGHLGFKDAFAHYIHAFNMPIFFFMSGYLFSADHYTSSKDFILRKAYKLLIPYLCFGLVNIAVDSFIVEGFDAMTTFKKLLSYNNNGLSTGGALWFLTALFFADVVFYVLFKYLDIRVAAGIGMVLAVGMTFCTYQLPFSMNAGFVGVGFMVPGYLLKQYGKELEQKLFRMSYLIWALLFVVNAGLIFVNGYVNMRKNSYAVMPLFFLNGIMAIVLYWIIINKFCNEKNSKWFQWLVYFSSHAIVMICLNELIITLVNMGFVAFESEFILWKIILKLVKLAVVLLSLLGIDLMLSKSVFRFMVGEKVRKKE